MTIDLNEVFADAADTCDGDFRNDYSGRGMNGKRCGALVGESVTGVLSALFDTCRGYGEEGLDLYGDLLADAEVDPLGAAGREVAVYFPTLFKVDGVWGI